jgi:hypothetical protein
MKSIGLGTLVLILSVISCKTDEDNQDPSNNDCEDIIKICEQTPPTNEDCHAFFQRWFFDKTTKACSEISYSGCTQTGFATKQECEACKCTN